MEATRRAHINPNSTRSNPLHRTKEHADMPIELDTNTGGGEPVVKRNNIGETFVGAIVAMGQRDQIKDDKPVLKDNGKPKREMVVTLMTIESTMVAGIGGVEAVPEPGDVVRSIMPGGAFGQWIDASKALREQAKRGVSVGDVVTFTTTHGTRFSTTPPFTNLGDLTDPETIEAYRTDPNGPYVKRRESFGMRGEVTIVPGTDEALIAACEGEYHARQQRTELEPAAAVGEAPVAKPWE